MIEDNYNSEQLDKLVNEIEGRLNDFDNGITDKDETIKIFAELVIKCAKIAVDSSQSQPEVKVNFTDTEPNFTKTLWIDHIKGQNIAEGDFEYKYVINALVTDGNKNKEFIKIAFKISAAKEIAQMLIDSI